jgi:hypothetical protein
VSILSVVDSRVDGDGPHGCSVPVTVAVIVLSPVSRGPDKDASEAVASLVDSANNGSHGGITRSIDCLSIVSWSPTGRVDVDLVGFVSHGVGLNEIGHVGLIKHSDSGNFAVIGNSDSADSVVTSSGDLTSTSRSVRIEPVISVTRVRERIVTGEVVTGFSIKVVLQIRMHIVDSIVHNCGGDVLSSEAKSPCLLDIEIETSFASSLTCVFQIPLVLVERIGRRLDG